MNRRVGKLLSISKLKDFSNNDCLSQLDIVTNSNELSQTLIIILSGRLILKLLFHLKRHEIIRKKEHHFFCGLYGECFGLAEGVPFTATKRN